MTKNIYALVFLAALCSNLEVYAQVKAQTKAQTQGDATPAEVIAAFSPLPDSPFSQFADLSLLSDPCLKTVWSRIPTRNTIADARVAQVMEFNSDYDRRSNTDMIIVGTGHAHSVAAAVILAEHGYQPIFKIKRQKIFMIDAQAMASMKYYASRMIEAKKHLTASSPVAFIVDMHRFYDFAADDFPTPEYVKAALGGKIILITEFFSNDQKRDQLGQSFQTVGSVYLLPLALPTFQLSWRNAWIKQYVSDPQIHVLENFVDPYYLLDQKLSHTPPVMDFSHPPPQCKGWENGPSLTDMFYARCRNSDDAENCPLAARADH